MVDQKFHHIFPIIIGLLLLFAVPLYGQVYRVQYESCDNCTGNADSDTTAYTYDAPDTAIALHVASDYGARTHRIYDWHYGIDYSFAGGDNDLGYHILSIEAGTVQSIRGDVNPKHIVINGSRTFYYTHIFQDPIQDSLRCGDLVLKKMQSHSDEYAIIHTPSNDTTVTAIATVVGTVVFKGDTLNTITAVTMGQVIAPLGTSGNVVAHLHLGSGSDWTENPLQHVNHEMSDYDVKIDTVRLFYPRSSIRTKCQMSGIPAGYKYTKVMNIDSVQVFIRPQNDTTFALIKGPKFYSKIEYSGERGRGSNPRGSNIYPTHMYRKRLGGVWNRTVQEARGSFTNQGMEPHAYNQSIREVPYDYFYLSDFYPRIHKEDIMNEDDDEVRYANVWKDARYPDGKFELYAKMTTIKDSVTLSDTLDILIVPDTGDTVKFIINNFAPIIDSLHLKLHASGDTTDVSLVPTAPAWECQVRRSCVRIPYDVFRSLCRIKPCDCLQPQGLLLWNSAMEFLCTASIWEQNFYEFRK